MAVTLSLDTPPVTSYLSPTTAIINLPALAHNLAALRKFLAPRCEILAIVKADGYGHGSIVIAKTLAKMGLNKFGVATIQEGVTLREAGVTGKIIVLGATFSWQLQDLIHYQLTPVFSDADIAHQFAKELSTSQTPFSVHLKVDTGMRRLGLSAEALSTLLDSPIFQGPMVLESLLTHLADADSVDPTFTQHQLDQFQSVVDELKLKGITIPCLHAANTAGIVGHPQSHLDMVRPGLLLYGYQPALSFATTLDLKPVLSLVTKLVQTRAVGAGEPLSYNGIFRTARPSRIGILPIGYAHGYNRRLSNTGKVLIGNTRAPIVGRICMDMTLVDITDIPNAKVGDDVVLLGTQGQEAISANEVAHWQDSIPYEVLCSIGPRVNRIYEPLS
jgi:alanine racemase